MKFAAKILATFAILILLTGSAQAAGVKIYPPRVPARPTPHFQPHTPRTTYDNRGGKAKRFVPQAPRR